MYQSSRIGAAVLVALSLVTAGCVTETTSGRVQPKENPEEAASLNVDLGISYLRQGDLQSAQSKLKGPSNSIRIT